MLNGSTASAPATTRAAPTCATCSAARAPTWPRWPASACRCRPASPSPPKSAPRSTTTTGTTRRARRLRSRRAGAHRGGRRPAVRRQAKPAAGLGPLRRPRLHARHDGHGAEPRPERRPPCWAWRRRPATSVSPGTATAASSRCIGSVVLGVDHHRFEEIIETPSWMRRGRGHGAGAGRLAARGRRLQGDGAAGDRQARSRWSRRSSFGARSAPCSAAG